MGRFVIAGYKPKPGQAPALEAVVLRHWDVLRQEALVSERPPHRMRAADGTIVEVFEWLSEQSSARAHRNPAVQALWSEFAAVCEHVPVGHLPETRQPFAEFAALACPTADS